MPVSRARMPTVKQLRYFVALAEERHFGRAAAQCFVSQSAFSTAIQELETLLDLQLVDRTNRRVVITSSGREIAIMARRCLGEVQNLVERARSRSRPLHGPLHLGVIPTIAPFVLPRVLPALRQTYPKLRLYLHEETTQVLHEQLIDGTLDLVLLALPYSLTGVETLCLYRDRFRLAACSDSRLVDPNDYDVDALGPGSVLLLKDGHCLREHAMEACQIRDTEKMARFSASSLLTLIEMVDADLGISYLPEMAVDSALLQNTSVRTYPLTGDNYREIGLVWRLGSARHDEFRTLGAFITEHRHPANREARLAAGPSSDRTSPLP